MGLPQIPARPRAHRARPRRTVVRPPPQPDTPVDVPYRLDIAFDLSLPLPPQLEAAKFRLVSRAAELRRQGFAAPKIVANQCERWTTMLRLIDSAAVPDADTATLLDEAQALVAGGYREILRLADGGAEAA